MIRFAWAAAAAAVLTQIAYPLVDGNPDAATNPALVAVTVISVLLFALASVAHAAGTFGAATAVRLTLVVAGLALAAEAVGVGTGFPFGAYEYADTLGPKLFDVPLLVPAAWVMMAYPCLLAGRAITDRPALAVLASGWLLASWDLFLDPQMVAAGHWRWSYPHPGLPGVDGIPLTNFAGWLLVALVIELGAHLVTPARAPGATRTASTPTASTASTASTATATSAGGTARASAAASAAALLAGVPALLLGWTWLGSGLANLVFFGRPAVALYGTLAMGLVAAPALSRARRAWTPPRTLARSRR
jgi:putative membrane protein